MLLSKPMDPRIQLAPKAEPLTDSERRQALEMAALELRLTDIERRIRRLERVHLDDPGRRIRKKAVFDVMNQVRGDK